MRMVTLRTLERINAEVLMTVSGQNMKRVIAGVRTPGTEENGARRRPKRCARLMSRTYAIYVAIARAASA